MKNTVSSFFWAFWEYKPRVFLQSAYKWNTPSILGMTHKINRKERYIRYWVRYWVSMGQNWLVHCGTGYWVSITWYCLSISSWRKERAAKEFDAACTSWEELVRSQLSKPWAITLLQSSYPRFPLLVTLQKSSSEILHTAQKINHSRTGQYYCFSSCVTERLMSILLFLHSSPSSLFKLECQRIQKWFPLDVFWRVGYYWFLWWLNLFQRLHYGRESWPGIGAGRWKEWVFVNILRTLRTY